tara:strand:- start:295 stop:600 length:306 start_codon:yes stop_codon:yes gene_type:complete
MSEQHQATELITLPDFLTPGSTGFRRLEKTDYSTRLVDIWDWWRAIHEGLRDGISADERNEWIGEALFYLHRCVDSCSNDHQRRGWEEAERYHLKSGIPAS